MKAISKVFGFYKRPEYLAVATIFALGTIFSMPMTAAAATIDISGTVAAQCSVSVTDLGASLDLVNGETSKNVASISETCNDPDGFTVSFSSSDAKLNGPTGYDVDYTINYDTLAAQSLATAQSVSRSAPAWDSSNNLQINLAGNAQLAAGTYTDTITISIAGQ